MDCKKMEQYSPLKNITFLCSESACSNSPVSLVHGRSHTSKNGKCHFSFQKSDFFSYRNQYSVFLLMVYLFMPSTIKGTYICSSFFAFQFPFLPIIPLFLVYFLPFLLFSSVSFFFFPSFLPF